MAMCSHCGGKFELKDGAIPNHDFPKPCRSICPGAGIAPAQRIALFGRYGVFSPYESHDGEVGITVQRIEPGDTEEDMGEALAEFRDKCDALLFAETKAEADDDARREAEEEYTEED